jgi:hypothetical protein
MIFLEILLLLIGLIISFVSLIKLETKKNFIAKRILSISYIFLFLLSAILIIIKYEDTKKSGLELFDTLHNIEKVISMQSDTLLNKTKELKQRLDKIVNKTEEAIIQREKSQKIFLEQNEILDKSNKLTQKQLEEGRPNVATYTTHITFSSSDSITTLCRIVFRNEGKRLAAKFRPRIIFLFKQKNNIDFKHIVSKYLITEIFPSAMLIDKSYLPFKYNDIISSTNGGTVIILLNYYDELLDEYLDKEFLFSIDILDNKIQINKENFKTTGLLDYLKQNRIELKIE